MSAEKGSSKTDTLVKVVLVFFISLLSFSVGTFVGKQVSDSDHRRLALEGEYRTDRSVASTEGGKPEAESADKISDKEVESLTEEFVAKEKPTEGEPVAVAAKGEAESKEGTETEAAAPNEKPAMTAAATEKPTTTTVATSKVEEKTDANGYKKFDRGTKSEKPVAKKEEAPVVAEKVATGKAPTDGHAAEERKPASTLPSIASSAVGKYTIQVGSYTSEKEAKGRAAELKGKGWNAFYVSGDVSGKTWYRVSVGLFNSMASANEFRAQFVKDAGTKAAMVRKITQ